MSFFSPISISLSPNTEKDDVFLAWKLIFSALGGPAIGGQPWQFKKGKKIKELEEEFKEYLKVKYAFSFNSGRSALMAILNTLDIKRNDEILLQAFTCNAAVNPILAKGAKPVFVDVDDTINLDSDDLKKKITQKSKAVMIQHTFGWPAQIDEILKIARENKLILIEDCAHSLGAKYNGKPCGTFGDAAFFSFGRDKIISSVFGGMVATNNEKIAKKTKEFQTSLAFPSNFWTFQQLLHPILMNYLILPLYNFFNLGKIFLVFFQRLNILSKAVHQKEKKGKIPKYFPKRLPNTLSKLALNQFRKLERFNRHRREIAKFYEKELKDTNFILPLTKPKQERVPVFMYYPILIKDQNDTDKILKEARRRKIYFNDGWRKSPVIPPDTDLSEMKYISGSCPKAEKIAKSIINLPTHINISKKEAKRIIDFLKQHGN